MIAHGTLLTVLVVGAAFGSRQDPPETLTPITVFDLKNVKLTDGQTTAGGAAPAPAPTPAPRPVTPPAPTPVTPVTPPPPTPPTRAETSRARDEVASAVRPDGELPAGRNNNTSTERRGPKINTNLVNRSRAELTARTVQRNTAQERAAREYAAYQERVANAVGTTVGGIRGGLSGSTSIDVPGAGGGAYVNYAQYVLGIFDNAWNPPPELKDDSAVVMTKIVIHRTGKIQSAEIIKRSGVTPVDRSVERALDAVRRVEPFPEGAKDVERTFKIEFNLKTKRAIG